ncbi:MAG: cell surface protein SprA [Paludibacteraceae bacterium]|nr:cell surface protein SprA [Paludibacteraceae bacterium]
MNKLQKIFVLLSFVVLFGTAYAVAFLDPAINDTPFSPQKKEDVAADDADTTKASFSVKNNKLDTYEDLDKKYPMDLKNPSNVSDNVEYDPLTGLYYFRTRVGNMDVVTPFTMNKEQYLDYSQRESMRNYWKEKIRTEKDNDKKKVNSITDMQINIGGADKIFGPGGVQVKMQGSAELLFGFKINKIQNPTLSERLRNPSPIFNFNEKIQLNVNGKVGDRVNFGLNYNTESSFDFDQSKIKLAYEGKEDDIIKKIEAGNVSMPLNTSLIKGSTALFGIRTDLQFGRLSVSSIISQQESESKTVNLKNGAQTTNFQIDADKYDEYRHFFLAQYFRDNFETGMSKLPNVSSSTTINRVQVWVTNKKADLSQSRNIIGFMDLGETSKLDNTHWVSTGSKYPYNKANSLYNEITALPNIRSVDDASTVMSDSYTPDLSIDDGEDYQVMESARLLDSSEYIVNKKLGYISLKSELSASDVLAVAYEYTVGGKVYQVGEFASDVDAPNCLVLKLLKGTGFSPSVKSWDLMMKNVYSLGSTQIQEDGFKLNVEYQNDSTGVYTTYISEGNIKNKPLLRVLKADRLNKQNQAVPDGVFDYVSGYTIIPSTGRIIFPVLEPFGSDLKKAIGDDNIASKYVYQELYSSTLTEALQFSEKNKFVLKGKYKGSSSSIIHLNAMNVPAGSVKVTAGGVALTENVDYTVDYSMGTVTILNQSILDSGTSISVSLENQSLISSERKTLVGTHLEYKFNKDFSVGGTIMHYSETPLTTKASFGEEPANNTIWGLNASYKTESQLLTDILNKYPTIKAKEPSTLLFAGEFAQLVPGHSSATGQYSYLDDFESSKTGIDIHYPYSWKLSSTPNSQLFPEATLSNNVDYGKNRALLAWYNVDPIFTTNTTSTPSYIKNDKNAQSNHYVRTVEETEVFPNKETTSTEATTLTVLNLSYYPKERGPYNLDATNINSDGSLKNPESRWGGIMRKMDVTDFEAANIEYVEFWMMDPFIYNKNATGGQLYLNLGDISEDILKDGKKAFENGLPADGDTTKTKRTVWGRVPKTQTVTYAFDNDASAREYQDVGLDGLRNEDEYNFSTYKDYLTQYKSKLSATALDSLKSDQFSALNDPAGDNYHYYRGSDYDTDTLNILKRYKHYNGLEGNSPVSSAESYSTAATTYPDVEDINQDYTLSQTERYYEYKVDLKPSAMVVGQNFITDKVTSTVSLPNGKKEPVTWYQFKVPVKQYTGFVGSISGYKSIQFMRMYLTGFQDETHLRFATMQLVRGDWINYTKALYDVTNPPATTGSLDVSTVSIEENSAKKPVNYVLPPGVTRQQDPSQTQVVLDNEQSLALKVSNLAPADAKAVYKTATYDLRQYKRLQMFVHAEKFIDDITNLTNSELAVFIRVGSDLSENYYEYQIPLKLTPAGTYSNNSTTDQEIVWPEGNMFDFPLSLFTTVKKDRNTDRRRAASKSSLTTLFSEYDPDNAQNKVSVIGTPNLSDVQYIMIGVRNQSRSTKSGEIWLDELRLSGFNEKSGYAALGSTTVNLANLGTVNLSGRMETAGFGSVESRISDRRMDDYTELNVSTNIDVGKLFPEKAKIKIPLYYAYTRDVTKPKYDPLNPDLLLSDVLADATTQAEKDSINNYSNTVYTSKSFNLTNVKVDIKSKKPMPYDPANFSLSYAYTESNQHDYETLRNTTKDYKASIAYVYTLSPKPWEPFKNIKALKNPIYKIITDFNLFYLPTSVAYSTALTRQYSEVQLRDNDNLGINYSDPYNSLLSCSKDFLWNRKFDLKYDLSRGLKFSYSCATNAQIQETRYTPVNKELFPTEYQNWKDTVLQSLAKGGIPLDYQQNFTANYTVPINKLPMFNWITSNVSYDGRYTWTRGTLTEDDEDAGRTTSSLGNNITSLGAWQFSEKLNLEQLYNKFDYLKRVNQRFSSRNTNNQDKKNKKDVQTAKKPLKYEQKLNLEKGKKIKITHKLNAEKIKVQAFDTAGNKYNLKYAIIDRNTIEVNPKDNIKQLKIDVDVVDPNEVKGFDLILQPTARVLMMFRNITINYNQTNSMSISGYKPATGMFGQNASAPGMMFAFGYQEPNFIQRAYDKDWLIKGDSTIDASIRNFTSDFTAKMAIEPIAGLKIDLGVARSYSKQATIQYMYDGMPTTYTGSFSMTTIAIGTFFGRTGTASNNYYSKAYETFKANRDIAQAALEAKYANTYYPASGFMTADESSALIGKRFNTSNGTFSKNSAEVLIPSFLSAYTGSSLTNSMDIIPSIMHMLPNWKITYDGLNRIAFVKEHFKSVNLTNVYSCKYSIGSFSSYANWIDAGDGLGFIPNATTGLPEPSSMYDISAVSITENFAPLLRVDVTLKNSLTFSLEYAKGRTLSMNIASAQLVESSNDKYSAGVGYRISNFDVILKLKNDKESKVKNDLNLRLDLSKKNTKALIRKLDDDDETQATSGESTFGLQFSAEYVFSSRMNFKLYYDRTITNPLVSTSYPTSSSDFGFSVKLLLTR